MSSLEELTKQQSETGGEIERHIRNYKKDPADRKTHDYLDQKSKTVTDLWEEFQSVDYDINTRFDAEVNHPYFTKRYFANIEEAYNWFIEDIERARKLIDSQDNPHSKVELSASRNLIDAASSPSEDPQLASTMRRLNAAMMSLQRALDSVKQMSTPQSNVAYEVKCRSVQHLWANVEALHDSLWGITDDPTTAGFNMDRYVTLSDEVEITLIDLQQRLIPTSGPTTPVANGTAPQVKLPTISLPKFDGNYLNWKQFHDLFLQVVHEQNLGNAQKMWYLKTSLVGEAERSISHLTLSDANYLSAWNLLKDRYNNNRLTVTALLNKLINQPTIHTESATSIRSLHDVTRECLLSLKNLQIDIKGWDPLLLHLLIRKLDTATHTLYEQGLQHPRELQSVDDFLAFLERRFQSLEALTNKGTRNNPADHSSAKRPPSRALVTVAPKASCIVCKGDHLLSSCPTFLNFSPEKRITFIQRAGRCVNCLKKGHRSYKCPSSHCRKCSKKHNTLLHLETTSAKPPVNKQPPQSVNQEPVKTRPDSHIQEASSLTSSLPTTNGSYTILSTVLVKVADKWSNLVMARAILDSGSQLSFISEKLLRKLGLQETKHSIAIGGIGLASQNTRSRANIKLHSNVTGFSANMEVHVLPKIISPQPSQHLQTSDWPIPDNIKLADPKFNQPGPIDILIGAELFYSVLSVGQIKLGDRLPTLQNTVFGWVVSGRTATANHSTSLAYCGICNEDERLDAHIQKFWQLEEVEPAPNNHTSAENKCEEFFVQTTRRDDEGRFIVRLPFRSDPRKLGESSDIALQRFYSLERKLARDPALKRQYVGFMREYASLGHMSEICFTMVEEPYFFLPHHCVLKPESTTTKLRVVFDGSAKTSTNYSLNDVLATGPVIQGDVFTVLLRFRLPRFVFTADIEKMYRQIQVNPADQKYQLIWWREDSDKPLKCYQLGTVTYGTTPASYLATRTLHMLSDQVQDQYPLAARSLKRDFYVDDVLSGSDHLTSCIQKQTELTSALKTAGIRLRKWCANHPQLLKDIPADDQAIELDFSNQSNTTIKTMGLAWQPKSDCFAIRSSMTPHRKPTKRTVSSDIAHIFDPLGILAPVVINAKLLLQRLWQLKLDWDAALPQELHTSWMKFREGLNSLNQITVPRHVLAHKITANIQLHVFADASEKAFGAAAYIRAVGRDNVVTVRLLCAKSKVAPVQQITLPRLELCAAKMAAQLKQRIKNDLLLNDKHTFLWSDSTAVLGWIKAESSNFHTFVANRIAAIQRFSCPEQWRHVRSADNPADLLSRGVPPEKLSNNNLWFYGPMFLHSREDAWPALDDKLDECTLERRVKVQPVCLGSTDANDFLLSIDHGNSFRRLQRIITYVRRFINATQGRCGKGLPSYPSVTELDDAQTTIIKIVQQQGFIDDIKHVTKYGEVAKNSPISSLSPFLDQSGVLRVGGRLESSSLEYRAKHPALLPNAHPITKMILNELHNENMHAGPQALLAITRQRFWPLGGKNIARAVVQHCVHCFRAKPKLMTQLMGNLPADRVQPARPFINSGVDFCGPVFVHFKIRGKRPQKAYIAVFCCFATKAVHLELVSDLSTDGFLGALRRFTARRGHCRKIYCDNATNFVGARNQLQELELIFNDDASKEKLFKECSSRGIDFHFIPPRAPHFGGLWEAAVKSAKKLMQPSLASASLTYEEMETVVIGVEAILNSRPITPMSNNANDLSALTPGHFLIGEPLTSTVDPQAQPNKASLLTRWKLVTHVKDEFWKRWCSEYLNQLQHRSKWKQASQNITPGTMVIMKEDNLPPLKWPLGRIANVIKGEDGLVRVVDVKTANNMLRRPIHRLAPLPTEEDIINPIESSSDQPNEGTTRRSSAEQNHRPAKRARSTLLSILLVCLILSPTKGSPATIHPFTSNPGLYFENLGRANVIASEWNIITYYNMQPFWREFELLQVCSTALHNMSVTMTHPGPYIKIANQIARVIEELDHTNHLLRHYQPSRIKRGLLNLVGNAANVLFGVLDSNYAEEMSKTIDAVKDNEGHLAALIRNQTSILDATINVMKRDHQAINKEFQRIEAHLNYLASQIDDTRNSVQEEAKSGLFTLLSLQAMLLTTNFQRSQGLMLDALTSTQQGRLGRHLISPDQLKDVLTTIRANLPANLRLPTMPDDILHLYNLITLEGRVTARHIIFKLKVPLIAVDDFDLFSVIPVPVKTNNSFIAIRPSFRFLMVNLHRDFYYPLSESQLRICLTLNGRYLCQQHLPLYKIGSSVAACEIRLLNQLSPLSQCQVMQVEAHSSWTQLHSPNQWIFSLEEKTTINIVCGETMSQSTLQGAGILKIDDNCIIKQPLITIHGHKVYSTVQGSSYIPPFNLSDIITASNVTSALRYHHHYSPHTLELESLKQRLMEMSTQIPGLMKANAVHHHAVGYGTLTIVIVLAIGLIWVTMKMLRPFHAERNDVDHQDAEAPQEEFEVNIG